MARFVVSYASLFYHTIESEIVEAESWQQALKSSSFELSWIFEDSSEATLDQAKAVAFNGDCMINVIEI